MKDNLPEGAPVNGLIGTRGQSKGPDNVRNNLRVRRKKFMHVCIRVEHSEVSVLREETHKSGFSGGDATRETEQHVWVVEKRTACGLAKSEPQPAISAESPWQ
jgi:hypothetical protein